MTLTEADIDTIQAYIDRIRHLRTTPEALVCKRAHELLGGLYTLRQIEDVAQGAYA